MRKNGRHLAIVAVLVVVGSVITYYLLTAIYQLPTAASAEAGPIDQLFTGHFLFISFFFSLIVVFVLYSIVAFRAKPDDEEEPDQFHGNTPLEIAWTIIPLIIVIGFGIWGWIVLDEVTAESPDEMIVKVRGQQWSWSFEYPDYPEIGVSSRMVLPIDQPVQLQMESIDVLHSFWVPEFRVKQDLLPGAVTTLRITPNEIGQYKVRCAEICGTLHWSMQAEVLVVERPEFDAWVEEQSTSIATLSPAERGAQFSTQFGCAACHSIDGSVLVGPTWQGLFGHEATMADGTTLPVREQYLLESILNPSAKIVEGYADGVMPANFEEQFAAEQAKLLESTGAEIDIAADIIEYIKTLSDQE
jgi:cytochrome c oxidase subunit 2